MEYWPNLPVNWMNGLKIQHKTTFHFSIAVQRAKCMTCDEKIPDQCQCYLFDNSGVKYHDKELSPVYRFKMAAIGGGPSEKRISPVKLLCAKCGPTVTICHRVIVSIGN